MKKQTAALAALILTNNVVALNHHQDRVISGNPIEQQNTYTVNSNAAIDVKISCEFNNHGKVPAVLNIWTSPTQQQAAQQILVNPKQSNHLDLSLKLNNDWWCSIYLPEDQRDQNYCSYFAISDATLSHYRPFATWNSTTRAKDSRYHCSLDNTNAAFFYFK